MYETILQAIPEILGTAMGLGKQLPEHSWRLREQLLARARQGRAVSARLLAGEPLPYTATKIPRVQTGDVRRPGDLRRTKAEIGSGPADQPAQGKAVGVAGFGHAAGQGQRFVIQPGRQQFTGQRGGDQAS